MQPTHLNFLKRETKLTMSQPRDQSFNPPSPRSSSGGAESFKGTPETRLTAFSPDDGSIKSTKLLEGMNRSASANPPVRLPVNSSRGGVSHFEKDPFVTPTHGPGAKLSPTASAFSPFSANHCPDVSPARVPSHTLSTDLGLSRHLKISSKDGSVSVQDVEMWLTVSIITSIDQVPYSFAPFSHVNALYPSMSCTLCHCSQSKTPNAFPDSANEIAR